MPNNPASPCQHCPYFLARISGTEDAFLPNVHCTCCALQQGDRLSRGGNTKFLFKFRKVHYNGDFRIPSDRNVAACANSFRSINKETYKVIHKLLDSRLPLMAHAPVRVMDVPYFEAIHEAGGLPVIDAEFFDADPVMECARKLDAKGILFAVRVPVTDTVLMDRIYTEAPDCLDAIVLSYTFADELKGFTPKSRDLKLVLELKDIHMMETVEAIRPDGLILKGLESGGAISRYTGYILLQWYLERTDLPVFLHGGVGMHTAAGVFASGASGVVLDSQLWLADESPVADNFRTLLEGFEEFDTVLIEGPEKTRFRFFAKLGTKIAHNLKQKESHFALGHDRTDSEARGFFATIREKSASLSDAAAAAVQSLFYLGQDASFARHFKARGASVSEMIRALFESVRSHIADVDEHDPIRENTALAKEHGTKYPVMQGPMANISDNPKFAELIFNAGALPFFAMGSLPPHLAEAMLEEGTEKGYRYGAGLIGIETFNKTLSAHLDLVKKYKSPFALFAGGVPAQVKDLEAAGTKTYLHTPASMMMENAIANGVTRFILEGTECGGHVGSLTSLVLWELGTERLTKMEDSELADKTLVYAGGISHGHRLPLRLRHGGDPCQTRCEDRHPGGLCLSLHKRDHRDRKPCRPLPEGDPPSRKPPW